jgi:glutaredoxin
MEFENPSENNFTIYSKSGCPNCNKVKTLLKENNLLFNIIDCDEYLLEDKENFLSFIEKKAEIQCKLFPIVFFNGVFIGGYNETKNYIVNMFLEFDETITF